MATLPPVRQMSDAELLRIILGETLANKFPLESLSIALEQLNSLSIDEDTESFAPLRPLKAARELLGRMLTANLVSRDCLTDPRAVRELLSMRLSDLQHEVFVVLLLNAQNHLIDCVELFRGSLTQTAVYPREVVKLALARNAAAVIFAHNHPSGVPEPSRADEVLTQTLKQALALVDVKVLDHFIVAGSTTPLSFAEKGLI